MGRVRRRGRTWRYPDRVRCLACRSYFGFVVVDGLFCSYGCARVPEPSADPADWPREHYSRPQGTPERRAKRDWMYRHLAERAAKRNGKQAYRCTYCLGWHIGSPAPGADYPVNRLEYR